VRFRALKKINNSWLVVMCGASSPTATSCSEQQEANENTMAATAEMVTRMTVPITCRPAQAIQSRLKAISTMPGWAAFLPTEVQTSLEGQLAVRRPYEETMFIGVSLSESQGCYGPAVAARGEDGGMGPQSAHRAGGFQSAGEDGTEDDTARPSDPVQALRGQVWARSRDAKGCWLVQHAFEEAKSDEERELLAQELRGHVWEAIKCPHANFVLQRCITTLKPSALQFIVDEIQKPGKHAAHHAAKHRYGCRVLERLIENCSSRGIAPLLEDLLADAKSLCLHNFGHYVMQHLIEHGSCEQGSYIIQILRENVASMAVDPYACSVVAKALCHGRDDDRQLMASALIQSDGVIASMACSRHGHAAVKEALSLANENNQHELNDACRQLFSFETTLRKSRYGKVVLAFTKQFLGEAQRQ